MAKTKTKTMTREQIMALLIRREEAIARRDIRGVAALHSEDCVVESPTAGATTVGRTAVEQIYQAWLTAFPDVVLTTDETLIDGERVVQVATAVGTDIGGFLGAAPTGKPFRLPMVFILTLRNQHIVRSKSVYDFTGLLVQVGNLKAKPV
jgi:steroid delta-isomerase-like uncharacterized protein